MMARRPAKRDASKMVVEDRPVAGLLPYARNARTHSDAQVAQIAASMREFGFTNPVLIDPGGGIIAGHGRVLAAKLIGLDDVPCIVLAHLTREAIAFNCRPDPRRAGGWVITLTGY